MKMNFFREIYGEFVDEIAKVNLDETWGRKTVATWIQKIREKMASVGRTIPEWHISEIIEELERRDKILVTEREVLTAAGLPKDEVEERIQKRSFLIFESPESWLFDLDCRGEYIGQKACDILSGKYKGVYCVELHKHRYIVEVADHPMQKIYKKWKGSEKSRVIAE